MFKQVFLAIGTHSRRGVRVLLRGIQFFINQNTFPASPGENKLLPGSINCPT